MIEEIIKIKSELKKIEEKLKDGISKEDKNSLKNKLENLEKDIEYKTDEGKINENDSNVLIDEITKLRKELGRIKETQKEGKAKPAESIKQETSNDKQEKSTENENKVGKTNEKPEQTTEKKELKKETKPDVKKPKKNEAKVNGRSLPISTKHSVALCNFIRNKDIDLAINLLNEVVQMKKPVPMKGEIPHKKGIMSGRYPVKASKEFIKLLNSLKANALYNEIELEKLKLFCKANTASRPYRRFGRTRFKRSHIELKLIPKTIGGKK